MTVSLNMFYAIAKELFRIGLTIRYLPGTETVNSSFLILFYSAEAVMRNSRFYLIQGYLTRHGLYTESLIIINKSPSFIL